MTGHIFVICGPSGVGKGTLVNRLLDEHPDFVIPNSYTTRAERPVESTKKTYHFVSENEFIQAVKDGKILEFEKIHGNLYGTDKESINSGIETGKTIIAEIEPKGARTFRELFKQNLTTIFISPPTLEELADRIRKDSKRDGVTEQEIETRLATAREEINFIPEADFVIINQTGKLDQAYQELVKIITTH